MILSDHIAALIEEMLKDGGGSTEVRRNDLAQKIGCVPSQISYVITSRFTPERGYVIDSRRGGGGFIRIMQVKMGRNEYLMHFFQAVGQSLGEKEAAAYMRNLIDHGIMTEREGRLAAQALSAAALDACPPERRDALRAEIFRRILIVYMM